MGNCILLLGIKRLKRPVKLLILGLDNAGKTTTAKGIVGDPVEGVAPTVGFCPENLEYRGCEITLYDVGGSKGIRKVWSNYFSEVHGLIFVVDSSDKARIEECHEVLSELISHKSISGKPILVLANKQDIEGALDEIDLVEALKIEDIVNSFKCPTRLETCSASFIHDKKPHKHIADGFRWLIDTIVMHYEVLERRVEKDMEEKEQQLRLDSKSKKDNLQEGIAQNKEEKNVNEYLGEKEQYRNDATESSLYDDQTSNTNEPNSYSFDHLSVQNTKLGVENCFSSSSEAQELKELSYFSPSSSDHSDSSSVISCTPNQDNDQLPTSRKQLESFTRHDPDIGTFTVDVQSSQHDDGLYMHSAIGSIFSVGSAISSSKKHIELESASERKPSRKKFLWVMQKTSTVSPET